MLLSNTLKVNSYIGSICSLERFKKNHHFLSCHAGLQKYTRYYVRVAASTEYGRGVLSNRTEFHTLADRK